MDLDNAIEDVVEEDPYEYFRSERMFKAARLFQQRLKSRKMGFRHVKTCVLTGLAGTGKSRLANYVANLDGHRGFREYHPTMPTTRWAFNNYDGEDTLILEDFFWEPTRINDYLRILDGYFYKQYAMYGEIYPCWTRVIITTNENPARWGENAGTQFGAIQRRITSVFRVDQPIPWNADGTPALADHFIPGMFDAPIPDSDDEA